MRVGLVTFAVTIMLTACATGSRTTSQPATHGQAPVSPPSAMESAISPPSAVGSTAATASPPAQLTPAPASPTGSGTAAGIPPLSAAAVADGLVDVRSVVPDAIVDLRYATADNFTHEQLYPVGARCLLHSSMADGLRVAAARLRDQGLRLVFWDCYRPHPVQMRMFEVTPDPAWVARPDEFAYSHEAGRSVDVTVARSETAGSSCAHTDQGTCLLDMGTGFDDFTPRAHAFATDGVSDTARGNRVLLREAMAAGGLQVYSGEWWHFDGPGAAVRRPLLTAPLT